MPKLYQVIDQIENVGDSKYIPDFSMGLNTTAANEKLLDNESIIRKNWSQIELGAIKKVTGFTKKNATKIGDAAITGLFRVYQTSGTTKLLAKCGVGLYYSNDDGATFTREAGTVAFTTGEFVTGVNYNDLFFFTGLTDGLYKFTPGTNTAAATTSAPTDKCRFLYKRVDRRLIAINNIVNGSTLYYSKIDPTGAAADDWSATNDAGSIAIDGAKSESLTGGATFGAYDIVFKDGTAFKVWGYPAPQAQKISGAPGCPAPYSIAQGKGLMFFLSQDAVWMYDGTRFIKISDQINSLIKLINPTYIQNAFGVYREGLYWLFYTSTSDTTNKDCLVYDVDHSNPYEGKNIWYERDALSMNCPIVFDGATDANELFAGTSQATGFVYRLDFSSTGADDTANIAGTYQTKYFDMGLPHVIKRFSKVRLRYYSATGSLIVTWYTNRGITSGSFTIDTSPTGTALGAFILGTDTLAEDTETSVTTRLPDNAVGKDISIKIYHTDIGSQPIIRNLQLDYEYLYEL